MASSRALSVAVRSAVAAVATLAVGCSSSSDHLLRIDSWPRGATVRVGEEGRVEGQTPIDALHLVIPEDGAVRIVLEKDGFQTAAMMLTEASPSRLFFPLQIAPDTERILGAMKALQASVENLGAAVNALRGELERSGRK